MSNLAQQARDLAARAAEALSASAGGPDHKIAILANYGDLALSALPTLADEIERLRTFIAEIAETEGTGGDPSAECELCRGELQRDAKRFLADDGATPGAA